MNLFMSFLHMHTTGREIYTDQFRNGSFHRTTNSTNCWADSFQQVRVLDLSVVIQQGDELQLSCTYDTSKRPDTLFDMGTYEEMSMDFVLSWPVQVDETTVH